MVEAFLIEYQVIVFMDHENIKIPSIRSNILINKMLICRKLCETIAGKGKMTSVHYRTLVLEVKNPFLRVT